MTIVTLSSSTPSKVKSRGRRRSSLSSVINPYTVQLCILSVLLGLSFSLLFLIEKDPFSTRPRENRHQTQTLTIDVTSDWPKGWKKMSFDEIWNELQCSPIRNDSNKPLPTLEEWTTMRDTFTRVVDPSLVFNDPVPPTLGYSFDKDKPIQPPFYAKISPGKGRGLFASRRIEKGELVHRGGTESDVIFPDGEKWRRYIFSLPRKLGCSIADWNWTQQLQHDGPLRMIVNLNIAALMNTGGLSWGIRPNVSPRDNISFKFYATKDIEKDEEILMDYDVFETNWVEVGL